MDPLLIAKILVCAFFAVCFLQSGIDKIVDWKGNLGWLTGHFSKTPFAKTVPFLLGVVTLFELAAGIFSVLGVAALLLPGFLPDAPFWGLGLAGASLLMLFTGQRIAKDYPGAATLATYFAIDLIGLWLLAYQG